MVRRWFGREQNVWALHGGKRLFSAPIDVDFIKIQRLQHIQFIRTEAAIQSEPQETSEEEVEQESSENQTGIDKQKDNVGTTWNVADLVRASSAMLFLPSFLPSSCKSFVCPELFAVSIRLLLLIDRLIQACTGLIRFTFSLLDESSDVYAPLTWMSLDESRMAEE